MPAAGNPIQQTWIIFIIFAEIIFLGQIKTLAGQTFWYGGSNVVARLLNYLLTPLLTYLLSDQSGMESFGTFSLIYSYFGLLNIIFTYGMETGYFRFTTKESYSKKAVFETTFGSLILSTLILCLLLYFFRVPVEKIIDLGGHPEYITLFVFILGFDTLSAIPFAQLRQENRPKKYAFIKIAGVIVNIILVVFFLVLLPRIAANSGFWRSFQSRFDTVSLLLLANVFMSIFVFLALFGNWRAYRFKFYPGLWKQIFRYSSPMVIIGLAGMINEVMDRQFLNYWAAGDDAARKIVVGIYSANYKLSIVITMFIQAFKMAAEPFFFNQSKEQNAPALYARVMNWFVITLCTAFLITALFLDYWKYFEHAKYRSGLFVVPVLLFANIFSGIYYNLSIWYKLTDKMRFGIYITVFGALITLVGNYFFIPAYGMLASAWSTLICYVSMVALCYLWGQKHFPVPYDVPKIVAYLAMMLLVFFMQEIVRELVPSIAIRTASGLLFLALFFLYVYKNEKQQMYALPVIGRLLKRR